MASASSSHSRPRLFTRPPTPAVIRKGILKPISSSASTRRRLALVPLGPLPPARSAPSKTNRNKKKKSSTSSVLDNIHRCPVCTLGLVDEDGLSMRDNYLKYKKDAEFQRRKLENGWDGKPIKRIEEEAIVVSTCGELFHKKCLLKFCSNSASSIGFPRSKSFFSPICSRPKTCPRCSSILMYSQYLEVDVDSHRAKASGPTKWDKSFDEIRFAHQELLFNRDKGVQNLAVLQNKLDSARHSLNQLHFERNELESGLPSKGMNALLLQTELELCRRRKSEKAWIENYISKAQRVIEYMQKETPNTMRLYLQEVVAKPLDEIPQRTPIPRMLIPHLHQIADDDYCLFALSQIVEPRPYPGTQFKVDDLLLGILKRVNPSLCQKLKSTSIRSGSSILPTYNALFPDTCLPMLKSLRDLRKAEEGESAASTPRDAHGNSLAITIMYVTDEDHDPADLKLPPNQHILAEKASNFLLHSTNGSSSSFINEVTANTEEDESDYNQTKQERMGVIMIEEVDGLEKPITVHRNSQPLPTVPSNKAITLDNQMDVSQQIDPSTTSLQTPSSNTTGGICSDVDVPSSTLTSIPSLPPPPCPSREKRQHGLEMLSPMNDEKTPPPLTTVNIETQCSLSSISYQGEDNATTTSSGDEVFVPPVRTNYGEVRNGSEFFVKKNKNSEKPFQQSASIMLHDTSMRPLIPLLPPIHAAAARSPSQVNLTTTNNNLLTLASSKVEGPNQSLEDPPKVENGAQRELSLLHVQTIPPTPTFLIECETAPSPKRKISGRLVPFTPSNRSLHSTDETTPPFFTSPDQALRVQHAISKLCVETGPPSRSRLPPLPQPGIIPLPPLPISPLRSPSFTLRAPSPSRASSIISHNFSPHLIKKSPNKPKRSQAARISSTSPRTRKNFIADNIAAASRTPVRPGAAALNQPITPKLRGQSHSRNNSGRFSSSRSHFMTPIAATSTSTNSAPPLRLRRKVAFTGRLENNHKQERRTASNSEFKVELGSKVGTEDIYSLLLKQSYPQGDDEKVSIPQRRGGNDGLLTRRNLINWKWRGALN